MQMSYSLLLVFPSNPQPLTPTPYPKFATLNPHPKFATPNPPPRNHFCKCWILPAGGSRQQLNMMWLTPPFGRSQIITKIPTKLKL